MYICVYTVISLLKNRLFKFAHVQLQKINMTAEDAKLLGHLKQSC